MDTSSILALIKDKLGIRTVVRDTYLLAIIEGIVKELEDEKGIILEVGNENHTIFIVDYVTWRYQSRDTDGSLPRHLQFRMHNLIISNKALNVSNVLIVDVLPVAPVINTVYVLDGTMQMYIDAIWVTVDIVNGVWVKLWHTIMK